MIILLILAAALFIKYLTQYISYRTNLTYK